MDAANYIKREKYLAMIRPYIGENLVKVLVGQRHAGKTSLLFQVMDEIKTINSNANFIYINAEIEKFRSIKTGKDLYQYVQNKLVDGENLNYLFLDELQEIDSYENTIMTLFTDKKCDIYCTSSSGNLTSGVLTDFLLGKNVTVTVHPLDYREFLDFHNLEDSRDSLIKYLTIGGLPYSRNLNFSAENTYEYLRQAYYSIMFQGIVGLEKLRNAYSIDYLVNYLVTNVGDMFTGCNMSNLFKSQNVDMAVPVIINYLKAMSNCFFIHKVARADFSTKIYGRGEKYFFEDLGMRNSLAYNGSFDSDINRLIENAVFLHLIYSDHKVFSPKKGEKELNFMAIKGGRKKYILVTESLKDEQKLANALSNFELIEDNYPRYIITLDGDVAKNSLGEPYNCISLREFLTSDI